MSRQFVSFDWAMKRLLRSEANFGVLEGFLSELLKTDITILEVLESASIKNTAEEKMNSVDLKVRSADGEIMIIDVQHDRDHAFFHRMLYSSSRIIVDHLAKGESYDRVQKVISVNLLYFNLGMGEDYIYHGKTNFVGMNKGDRLLLEPRYLVDQNRSDIADIYPEYYLIKINKFDNIAKNTLDEWIYFLKNDRIEPNFTAKGIHEAEAILDYLKLTPDEQSAHEDYLDARRFNAGVYHDKFEEGREKGREEGEAIGIEKGRAEAQAAADHRDRKRCIAMRNRGDSVAYIADTLELTEDDVRRLLDLPEKL